MHPSGGYLDILLVKHGALGDVVRTSWLLPGLHDRFGPATRIDWLTAPGATDLLRFNPFVDRVLTAASELRPHYEWILSLDDELHAIEAASSASCRLFSGARLKNGRREYTEDVAPWFDMGLLSRLGKARADAMKVENGASHAAIFSSMLGVPISGASFFNSPSREARWQSVLRDCPHGAVLGINPFAGGRWPTKALPPSTLSELLPYLLESSEFGISRVVLFSEDSMRAHALLAKLPEELAGRIVVPETSESTLELAAAIRTLDYLITTDSLALHLAVAQSIPSLSFYAPTSAAEIETFDTGVKLLSTAPDYCSYRSDADNTSIIATRLLPLLKDHWIRCARFRAGSAGSEVPRVS